MANENVTIINKSEGYWSKCTSNIALAKKKFKEEAIDRLIALGHTPTQAQLIFHQQQRLFKR